MHAVCYLPLSNAETGPKIEGTDYEESSQKSLFSSNLSPMNDFRCFSSPGSIWTNKLIQNSLRPKSAGEWNWTVWTALRKLEHLCHVYTWSRLCTHYIFRMHSICIHLHFPAWSLCLQSLKIVLSAECFGPLPCKLCAGCRLSTAKD